MKAIILAAVMISGAAVAQEAAQEPATQSREGDGDVTQIVCRTEVETGSRINRRRVCRTRAEWAEHRGQYRDRIERAQQQMQTGYGE